MTNPSASSIDRRELLERVEDDEELAREILAIFRSDVSSYREALRVAVESKSQNEVRKSAHAFKGMLANLAATTASTLAASLEQLGKDGHTEQFAPAWDEFQRELDHLLRDVDSFLAGAGQ